MTVITGAPLCKNTMSGQLVLLTGATAHVGYRTLIEALSRGHKVRAAVRSESKVSEIKAARSTQSYLNQLAFIIVPNIETDGAFDKAVKGVESIVHVASFLAKPSDDDGANIVRTAIRGTLSILYSALKEPSVKRVVITSSVVAVNPASPTAPYTADNVEPDPTRTLSTCLCSTALARSSPINVHGNLLPVRNRSS